MHMGGGDEYLGFTIIMEVIIEIKYVMIRVTLT